MEAPTPLPPAPDDIQVGDWIVFPMRGILAHDPIRLRVAEIDREHDKMLLEQHFAWGAMKMRQSLPALANQMRQFTHRHIRPTDE